MRWLKLVQKSIPTVDLVDISDEVNPFYSQKRQFSPEYSFKAYCSMLQSECAIGNYLERPSCSLQMTNHARQ